MKIFFKMLLHCGGLVQWRPCSHRMIVCSASPSVTAEQVRQELDNLHKEADTTRAKGKFSFLIYRHLLLFVIHERSTYSVLRLGVCQRMWLINDSVLTITDCFACYDFSALVLLNRLNYCTFLHVGAAGEGVGVLLSLDNVIYGCS